MNDDENNQMKQWSIALYVHSVGNTWIHIYSDSDEWHIYGVAMKCDASS